MPEATANPTPGSPAYGLGESWHSLNTLAEYLQTICGLSDGLLEQVMKGVVAAVAAEREACARLAEDERVIRAIPPYDDIRPDRGDGWYELWPHAGYRIAAYIRARSG